MSSFSAPRFDFQSGFVLNRQNLELSNLCGTGPYILEKWELGKGFLDLYRLEGIARVFDKQLTISFEPLPKDS